jgi:hypothetical protein
MRELVCATCLLPCRCAGVDRVMTVDGNEEGQVRVRAWWTESGKGQTRRHGPRDRGPEDGPWTASTWAHLQENVHVRIVMETTIEPSQGGHTSTW